MARCSIAASGDSSVVCLDYRLKDRGGIKALAAFPALDQVTYDVRSGFMSSFSVPQMTMSSPAEFYNRDHMHPTEAGFLIPSIHFYHDLSRHWLFETDDLVFRFLDVWDSFSPRLVRSAYEFVREMSSASDNVATDISFGNRSYDWAIQCVMLQMLFDANSEDFDAFLSMAVMPRRLARHFLTLRLTPDELDSRIHVRSLLPTAPGDDIINVIPLSVFHHGLSSGPLVNEHFYTFDGERLTRRVDLPLELYGLEVLGGQAETITVVNSAMTAITRVLRSLDYGADTEVIALDDDRFESDSTGRNVRLDGNGIASPLYDIGSSSDSASSVDSAEERADSLCSVDLAINLKDVSFVDLMELETVSNIGFKRKLTVGKPIPWTRECLYSCSIAKLYDRSTLEPITVLYGSKPASLGLVLCLHTLPDAFDADDGVFLDCKVSPTNALSFDAHQPSKFSKYASAILVGSAISVWACVVLELLFSSWDK